MNLQSHYDLKIARTDLKAEDIKRISASTNIPGLVGC
jgi:plasmid maintenance system antidote protein VapI